MQPFSINSVSPPASTGQWILALLLIVLLAACGGEQHGTPLPPLPDVAVDGFLPVVQGQIQAARRKATDAPQDAVASGRLGMILHAYAQYEWASVCYERARLLDPDNQRWAYLHAQVLAKLGWSAQAIEGLRQVEAKDAAQVEARLKLAELLLAAGKPAESRKLYEDLVDRYPNRIEAQYGLARVLLQAGELETAIQRFQRTIELGGPAGVVYYSLATAYRQQGDAQEAQRHLALNQRYKEHRIKRVDPQLAEVAALNISDAPHIARGEQYVRQGRVRQAIAEFEKAVQRNPQSAAAHATLVGLYGHLGDLKRAQAHFDQAVQIDRNLSKPYFNLGMAKLKVGRYAEAAKSFRRTVEIDPHDAHAYSQLGLCLERQGQVEEALAQYRLALTNDPNHREAHFLLGRRLALQGHYAKAVEHLEATLKPEDEKTPTYLGALAGVYELMGDIDLAIATLTRAQAMVANNRNGPISIKIRHELDKLRRRQAQ